MAITQQRCVCGLLTAERMNGASIVRGEHAWIDCVSVSMCLCVYNYMRVSRCLSVFESMFLYVYVCMWLSLCANEALCLPVSESLCPSAIVLLSVCVYVCLCPNVCILSFSNSMVCDLESQMCTRNWQQGPGNALGVLIMLPEAAEVVIMVANSPTTRKGGET